MGEIKKPNNNLEFKKITEAYKASKRFISFATNGSKMLHENALIEEITYRKKIIFNFECSLALLDEELHRILSNEINEENSLWYVGTLSRSSFYRNRQKAIEIFLKTYHRLETL